MSQNLLAINFERECLTSTVKACFDALKQYKQRKMQERAVDQLDNGEMVRIRELTIGIEEMTEERLQTNKKRVIEAIKICMQKKLWSYIRHWR